MRERRYPVQTALLELPDKAVFDLIGKNIPATVKKQNRKQPATVMLKQNPLKILMPVLLAWFCLALVSNAWGAALTWDANTSTTGAQDGSGTWSNGAGGWWNGSANVNWNNSDPDTATFGAGSDGTYAIAVGGSITCGPGTFSAPGLIFANSGYTLSASSAQTITFANGNAVSYLKIASVKTNTIGSNVTISKPASANGINFVGGGTLIINSGGTISHNNNNANAIEGGTTLQINGGSLTCGSSLVVGNLTSGEGSSGTFTINSGSVSLGTYGTGLTAAGNLNVGRTAGDNSIANLNGGTVTCYAVTGGSGTGIVNWNGGTVKARASANSAFIASSANLTVNILAGGAIMDNNGQALTFTQPLVSGASPDGGFTLNDSGANATLTLNAAETYNGPTVVAAGTLALGSSATLNANSVIGIAGGATFDVSAFPTYTFGSGSALLATNQANLKGNTTISLNSRPAKLKFTPTSFSGDTAHPALTVTAGQLTVGGSTIAVINGAGSSLGVGDYTVIKGNTGSVSGTPTLDVTTGVGAGTGLAAGTGTPSLQLSGSDLILHVPSSSKTATTTTITLNSPWSSTSTSTYGDAVSFHVAVTTGTPTGAVTIYDGGTGGTQIGTGTLSSGAVDIILSPVTLLAAGAHNNIVAVYGGDSTYAGSTSTALALTVNQKALTVSSATAANKLYDGTATASVSGTLSGVVGSDNVTLNSTGTFANAGPGTSLAVTFGIGGTAAANYSLTQPGATANIYASAVWNNPAGGGWDTAGNWLNSMIGTGSNVTADFSQVDITSDTTVSLNSARTIGNLIFGNTDATPAANWILDDGGNVANTLTLLGAAPTVTVNALGTGKTTTISAVVAGTSGLTKSGNGTLVLSGNNTFSGATVNAGTLTLSATDSFGNGTTTVGAVSGNGVLNVTNGATVSATSASGTAVSFVVGNVSGANGAVNVSGTGSLTVTGTAGEKNLNVGTATGGYGYLNMTGGTLSVPGLRFGGLASGGTGTGVGLISGGTVTLTDYLMLSRAGGTTSLTIAGGTVNRTQATPNVALAYSGGRAELNLTGGTLNSSGSSLSVRQGVSGTATGIVNLNSGTLTINACTNSGGSAFVNFNGGTLQAGATHPYFISGSMTAVNVFSGGATINDGGYAVTNAAPLVAPGYSGITGISMTTGLNVNKGSGYIGAPYVSITGGTLAANGCPATAIANMAPDGNSALQVDSLTITCPGVYSDTTTVPLAVSFIGGGGSGATAGTISTALNPSGGLTKLGTGALTLPGANTYTGNTTISAGTLALNGSGSINNSPNVVVSGGSTFDVSAVTGGYSLPLGNALTGKGTVHGAASIAGTLAPGADNSTLGTLTFDNTLTLSGNANFRVNRTSGTLTSDQVAGATTVTAGGTLNVSTASGSDALQDGDTFTLFNVAPGSTFSTINLPNPGVPYNWNTANNYQTIALNLWPTAGTATYYHNRGIQQHFTVTDLLSHVTGAISGKTITLTSLAGYTDLTTAKTLTSGATLQASGTLSSGSTLIFYTPASTDSGDSLTYVVSDGRGGTPAGTVSLLDDTSAVFGQQSPQMTADGSGNITIKFYGVPGYSYYVQRATDVGFSQNVTELGPYGATTDNPVISITDPIGSNAQAYYRLEWRP